MKFIIFTIVALLTLPTFVIYGLESKILKGIAVDGHRNPIIAVNVIIKGTAIGTVTDVCGEFSIPIDQDSITLMFHGVSYDDMRTYEIGIKRKDITDRLFLFQLGHWKVRNRNCKKLIDKKMKPYVMD